MVWATGRGPLDAPNLDIGSNLVAPMELAITVLGDATQSGTHSLNQWLHREDGLRGRIQAKRTSPSEGEMGTLLDTLTVAVGSSGALAILARSLHTWLKQPRRAIVRLRVKGPDGVVVDFTAEHVKDLEQIEALLRQALSRRDAE